MKSLDSDSFFGEKFLGFKEGFLIIFMIIRGLLSTGKRECYRKGRNIKYRRDESIMVRDNREAETEGTKTEKEKGRETAWT